MATQDTVSGYRIERLIGRGTMAAVYLATSTDGLDRQVAIKRLNTIASESDHKRMRREAQTMASLDHPNIMSVLEVVEDGDGIALVLPFAANGSLAQRIAERGPLQPSELLGVIEPVASALTTAHQHGILHRDVKPSNILFNDRNEPLLADFGIASNTAHTNLTRTDVAIGTAGYLDPEVADGAEPSESSDLYALGVVAHEALAGKAPFTGATPLAVLRAADRGEATALGSGNIALDQTVRRAFARRRTDRWASVTEFASTLRTAIETPGSLDFSTRVAASGGHTAGFGGGFGQDQTPSVDAGSDGTVAFKRKTSPSLSEAKPAKPKTNRILQATAAALGVVMLLAGGFLFRTNRDKKLPPLPVTSLPKCLAIEFAQCVTEGVRTSNGMSVKFANGLSPEYVIGNSDDLFRLGNFFCGNRATLAMYQPKSGRIFYLSSWPDPNVTEPTSARVDETGIIDANVGVADHNRDGCADIALDKDGKRTWFLPVIQKGRLGDVKLDVSFSGGKS